MLNQSIALTPAPHELPAITDWDDFATWCRQEGRQALPASDDTLTCYLAAKAAREQVAHVDSQKLGWFALIVSVTALLLPIFTYLVLAAMGVDPKLSESGALLLFGGLQLIALTCAWNTRHSIEGRAAWRMACLASATALLVIYVGRDTTALLAIKSLVSN